MGSRNLPREAKSRRKAQHSHLRGCELDARRPHREEALVSLLPWVASVFAWLAKLQLYVRALPELPDLVCERGATRDDGGATRTGHPDGVGAKLSGNCMDV